MSGIEARLAEVLTETLGWDWDEAPGVPSVQDCLAETVAALAVVVAEEVTAARAEACEQVAVAIEVEACRLGGNAIQASRAARIARAAAPPSSTGAGVVGES